MKELIPVLIITKVMSRVEKFSLEKCFCLYLKGLEISPVSIQGEHAVCRSSIIRKVVVIENYRLA